MDSEPASQSMVLSTLELRNRTARETTVSLVTENAHPSHNQTVVENARSVSFDTEVHTISEQQPEADLAIPDFKKDLLGDNNLTEASGLPVHNLLVEKLSSIFSNGFTKETRELLIKNYPPSVNLPLCRAPLLNQEIRQDTYNPGYRCMQLREMTISAQRRNF